jgi:hypothetical protein
MLNIFISVCVIILVLLLRNRIQVASFIILLVFRIT